jgi:ribosomal protein S4E
MRDDVFQVRELIEPYRVVPLIDLEENLNFHVFDNIFIDVKGEELNVVLSSKGQAQVDEDDGSNIINIEDYDGADKESIKEEEEEEDNSN